MTSSHNITYWAATSISYMRILRGKAKFSNLPQIIIQLERGRGGIKKQAGLLNVYVYLLLNSTCIQGTLHLLWQNKKMNVDNSIFNSALLVYFFHISEYIQEYIMEMNGGNEEDRL